MDKKTNKILIAIVLLTIIVGIVVTCIFGLNFGLVYQTHKRVDIKIGKTFESKDIKDIVKEVTSQTDVIIEKVELYEDMVSIHIKDISDEQLENLNTKINEKYQIENKINTDEGNEGIYVYENEHVRGRTLIKPYVKPVIISIICIALYMAVYMLGYAIYGNKTNVVKDILIIAKNLGIIFIVEMLYLSIIAITRIPVNRLTIPVGILIYAITTVVEMFKLEKKFKTVGNTKNNK